VLVELSPAREHALAGSKIDRTFVQMLKPSGLMTFCKKIGKAA
jgi:hypothetical protein